MRQMALAHQAEFQRYSRKKRREQIPKEMDAVMPWAEPLALVQWLTKGQQRTRGPTGRRPRQLLSWR